LHVVAIKDIPIDPLLVPVRVYKQDDPEKEETIQFPILAPHEMAFIVRTRLDICARAGNRFIASLCSNMATAEYPNYNVIQKLSEYEAWALQQAGENVFARSMLGPGKD